MPRGKIANTTKGTPTPWKDSEAKHQLRQLLESNSNGFWHSVDPHELHRMSELFMAYDEDRFVCNLKNLKVAVKKEKDALDRDHRAYEHDMTLYPRKTESVRGYKMWEGSTAQKLLRQDVKNKVHKNHSPKELHRTRPEYLEFPLDVFRKHIYQEEYAQSA